MSKASDLLKMFRENHMPGAAEIEASIQSFDPADAAASFQKNMQVVTSMALLKQIQTSCGAAAGNDFKNLVLRHEIPKDRSQLVHFFQGRRDLVSMACLKQLTEPSADA